MLGAQPAFLAFGAAAAVALVLGALLLVGQSAGRLRARRHRIEAYVRALNQKGEVSRDRRSESKRKQISNKMKSLQESKKHGDSRVGAVRVHLMRAGINVTLAQFWLASSILGAVSCLIWFFLGEPPPGLPLVFGFATFILPRMILGRIARRRQKEFTRYFSTAIDVIVRGLKSGLPVQECFRIIGREIPDPCGSEFRIVIDEVNAGLTLYAALERSFQRMPTQELRFFSTIIGVQAQTGGNLAEILSTISSVLRGRHALREKIKALSSEARMSSIIVGAMPFFVVGVLTIVNYAYVSLLWTTSTGKMVLALACTMMALGMFIMNRMGKLDM